MEHQNGHIGILFLTIQEILIAFLSEEICGEFFFWEGVHINGKKTTDINNSTFGTTFDRM